jgi:hypothetical protein
MHHTKFLVVVNLQYNQMKKPFSVPQDKKKLKYVSSALITILVVGFTIGIWL